MNLKITTAIGTLALLSHPIFAQEAPGKTSGHFGFWKLATSKEIAVLDIDVRPDGNGYVKVRVRHVMDEFSDSPYMTREETSKYTYPVKDKIRVFNFEMDARSITGPMEAPGLNQKRFPDKIKLLID
jgi:hypothetical protein